MRGLFAVLTVVLLGACTNGLPVPGVGVVGGKWRYHCGPAKKVGEYCETQEECAKGSFCDTGKKACSNAFSVLGGPCQLGVPMCPTGAFCKGGGYVGHCYTATCSNGACTTGAKLGTTCSGTNEKECGANAMCVMDETLPATCALQPKSGEPCEGFGTCADGLECMPPDMKCALPTPVGGACKIKETCQKGLWCLLADKSVPNQPDQAGT